jgi:hypothetical protein
MREREFFVVEIIDNELHYNVKENENTYLGGVIDLNLKYMIPCTLSGFDPKTRFKLGSFEMFAPQNKANISLVEKNGTHVYYMEGWPMPIDEQLINLVISTNLEKNLLK